LGAASHPEYALLVSLQAVRHRGVGDIPAGQPESPCRHPVNRGGLQGIRGNSQVLAQQHVTARGRVLYPLDVVDALRAEDP
jgi:hypothetical protein